MSAFHGLTAETNLDCQGELLQDILDKGLPDIRSFLQLAVLITEALSKLHDQRTIYNNIGPHSIMINQKEGKAALTDFSNAFQLDRIRHHYREQKTGHLLYISPEATGRLNRRQDFRSDLYSLGILFYLLLCGSPPFDSQDPMEIIHCHLAKKAIPPAVVNPAIPQVLSDMVEKLLAKRPEDRYQTAYGLASDLRKCQDLLQKEQDAYRIEPFPLGESDIPDDFRDSSKLYNRDSELEQLRTIFRKVKSGSLEMVFIAGYPGSGKTSLVNLFLENAASDYGVEEKKNSVCCASGKYDQYSRINPYHALSQAFKEIVKQILMESEETVTQWKKRICDALYPNLQVIIDIIPELERIVGPQPPVMKLPPQETQNRFDAVFLKFIQLFGLQERPLVLFLDDLQWADLASIRLLRQIALSKSIRYTMVIGAFRDNQSDEIKPIRDLLDSVGDQIGQKPPILSLQSLNPSHINQMLEVMLSCGPNRARELADVVFDKTKGNPFFLNLFLRSLKEEHLIWFDRERKQWEWNIRDIKAKAVTDNVVDLMIDKINRLPPFTVEILKYAACVNNQIETDILSIVAQKTTAEILTGLQPALDAGLIVLQKGYFAFLHDRVQQAVYSIIDEPGKRWIHYVIGITLYKQLEEGDRPERQARILEITDHLNLGNKYIHKEDEKLFLFQLNLASCKIAKSLSDFPRALGYCLSVYPMAMNIWTKSHTLALEFYVEYAEAAYACSDFELMDKITAEALDHTTDALDKAKVYEVMITAYTARNELGKAMETARYILGLLGFRFPAKPTLAHVLLEYLQTVLLLKKKKSQDLQNIPFMTNEKYMTALRICVRIGTASYSNSYTTFYLLAFKALRLSLKHGITEGTPAIVAAYGCITTFLRNRPDLGYYFFSLAFQMQERLGTTKYSSKAKILFHMMAWNWENPKKLIEFPEAYQSAIAEGDLLSAGYSITQYFVYSFMFAKKLTAIVRDMNEYYDALLKTGHETSIRVCEIYMQAIRSLAEDAKESSNLSEQLSKEEELLAQYIRTNDRTVIFNFYFMKYMQLYLRGRAKEAYVYLVKAESYLDGVLGSVCVPLNYFYKALVLAANYENMKFGDQLLCRRKIRQCIRAVSRFAANTPISMANKLYLMKAEYARLKKDGLKAAQYYDRAIDLAAEHQLLHEEALAYERAGQFYIQSGRETIGGYYLNQACSCYREWGAAAKVKDLQRQYGKYLAALFSGNQKRLDYNQLLFGLDIYALFQLSQTISREIVLEDLLKTLLDFMLKYSGARKIVFIMNEQGKLTIEAEGSADGAIRLMQSCSLENSTFVPAKLISYVARTGETMIFRGDKEYSRIYQDDYLTEHRPQSVLCLPVSAKGNIIGIFYLENDLTEGVFKNEFLNILQLLSSQIAISIENAKSYKNLENIIEQHTKELKEKNLELMEANEKLLKANEAKMRFVANVSHEIRTPLQGMIGMINLMLKSGEYNHNYLLMADSSARLLSEIVSDVLDISKIESAQLEISEKVFHLPSLLKQTMADFESLAAVKGIALSCREDPDLPAYLIGDALRLRQILNNLLSNAVKFTPQGTVELTVRLRGNSDNHHQIEFRVKDTGIGIPKDQLETIFDDFIQLESPVPTENRGIGLGLAIVKNLVGKMKGTIEVSSTEGKGSVFSFILPFKEAEFADIAGPSANMALSETVTREMIIPSVSGLKIIAAEDNEVNRIYIKNMLEYYQCEITVVANGKQLLEQLIAGDYDCVLMDKNMPEIDGIEATRIIRKLESGSGKHLPIIALTASAIAGDREKLLSEGMDYYLAKPIEEKRLLEILAEIRERKENSKDRISAGGYHVVNYSVLKEEAELFGRHVYLQIINQFLADSEKIMAGLEGELQAGELAKTAKIAHKLAGSISCFYADEPYRLLKDMEIAAENRNQTEVEKIYPTLQRQIKRLLEELHTLRDELARLDTAQ